MTKTESLVNRMTNWLLSSGFLLEVPVRHVVLVNVTHSLVKVIPEPMAARIMRQSGMSDREIEKWRDREGDHHRLVFTVDRVGPGGRIVDAVIHLDRVMLLN